MPAPDPHGNEDRDPREAFLDHDPRDPVDDRWPWPDLNNPGPILGTVFHHGEDRFFQTEARARDELGRDSTDLLLEAASTPLPEAAERYLRAAQALDELEAAAARQLDEDRP